MNTMILYAMGIASLFVIIAGGVLCVSAIAYMVYMIWVKFSNVAHNVVLYLRNKTDFESYIDDFARWENRKRINADKCRHCEYREKVLKSEDLENG